MEPKIVNKPAFSVVGLRYQGRNQNDEIGALWGEFNPRAGEIRHVVNGTTAYGVCFMPENVAEGEFEYVAGLEVDSLADIPEGMVGRTVGAQQYAVFPSTLQNLKEVYEYAYQTWLPGSGYRAAGTPDFELYDEHFNPEDGSGEFFIYVPIVR